MAQYTATRVASGGGAVCVHSGAGRLQSVLLSHDQASVQAVTFYDNTSGTGTVLFKVYIAPERCPVYLFWGEPYQKAFTTGLTVDPGDCEVNVWCTGF